MAENWKQCSICLDDFKRPRIIHCIHTFCEVCLDRHLLTNPGSKKFSCPICRRRIMVPINGAKGVPINFYVEDKSTKKSISDMCCPDHSPEYLDRYCIDCQEVVCSECIENAHKDHEVQSLHDFCQTMMVELGQLKKGLEWQTPICQTYVNSIKTNITELRTSTKMVYKDVDTQVDRIIQATKKLGQNIKDERRKTHDDIMKTLTTLSDDFSGILHQLQSNIKSSAQLLKDAPTVEIIKQVQMIKVQKKENDKRRSYLPDLPLSNFSTSEIKEDALRELFGFVEGSDSCSGMKSKRPRTTSSDDQNDEGLQSIVQPTPAPCSPILLDKHF